MNVLILNIRNLYAEAKSYTSMHSYMKNNIRSLLNISNIRF